MVDEYDVPSFARPREVWLIEPCHADMVRCVITVTGLETWECKTEEEFRALLKDKVDTLHTDMVEELLPKWKSLHKQCAEND